ncbi:MAG TPA: hypothetical protein VFB99_10405 [Vicinamibacterales bacterium]|nr:hypothetical protein [Vicinamibacterales bacterium]
MRLLVCGNRDIPPTCRSIVRETLLAFQREHGLRPSEITVIHGGNGKRDSFGQIIEGLDILVGDVAMDLGWHVIERKAEWKRLGHAAGPIRNQRMIDEERPTHGMAFGDIGRPGTGDCVKRMRKAGFEPALVSREELGVPVRCYPRRK